MNRRIIFCSLVLALAINACGAGDAQQQAQIEQIFAQAEAADVDGDRAFHVAMQTLAKVRTSTAACSVPFVQSNQRIFSQDFARWIAMTKGGFGFHEPFQSEGISIVETFSDLRKLLSSARASRRREQKRLLGRVDEYAKMKGAVLVARAKALVELAQLDLIIHTQVAKNAKPIDEKTFRAGTIIGRAYLYDPAAKAVVCAGDVSAQSSEQVTIWRFKSLPSDQLGVTHDLYYNLIETAVQALRRRSS